MIEILICESDSSFCYQKKIKQTFVFCLSTVAPDKVTIKGPSEAKVGDSLRFECSTSNSNPPASVQWVVDGRVVNENFTHSVSHESSLG
jgi:hypothetical protein